MRQKLFAVVMFLMVGMGTGIAQQGFLKGKITDKNTGEELVGAAVVIDGTTTGTITNFMGEYIMPALDAGTYTIRVQYISYDPIVFNDVVITAGKETELNIQLAEATMDIAEVAVVAKANRESENYLMMEQKKASIIKESIGAKRMATLGVSDASDATSKISGVTKSEGSGDVYIRGLGDRYLTTTLNGLPVPSDDVEKKNIDLNLFGTGVIKNVGISKTYSPDGYADQTSGIVDISTKTTARKVTLGVAGGANTNVFTNGVFSDFKASQNYNDQTLGYYSAPYNTKDAITQQSWNTTTKKMPLNYGVSLAGGGKVDKLSFFGSLSQTASSDYYIGEFKSYRSNVLNTSFDDVEQFQTEYNTTALASLTYDFDINNILSFNSLYVHKTTDINYEQGRNGNGFVYDQDPKETEAFVRDQNLKQTSIFVNQLLGTHTLGNNTVKWALGYNTVNAEEPNRIRNEANMYNSYNQFAHVGDFQQRKSTQGINDNELNGYLKDEIKIIDEDNKLIKVDVGANFRNKSRDFNSLFVGVKGKGVQFESIDNMDEVLLDEELYNNGSLQIKNRNSDLYNADLSVYSGFANFTYDVNKLAINIGARYEVDKINVAWDVANYINPETGESRIGSVTNNYNNFLPALNLKYNLNDKSALRFATSKTITLPEFKEIAPFEYVSPTGRVTKGNPNLQKSDNYNFDLKYEMFPSRGQLISATAFYKIINDPINMTQTRGSSGYFYYANTGEQANIYGFEVEGRFDLIKAEEDGQPSLGLVFNATKMWFEQDLLKEFQYNNKTNSDLQGASDLILNGSLTFNNHKPKEFISTLSANYSSDKIFALGAPEDYTNSDRYFNNEIIEKGFVTVDLVLIKKVSERVSLKFTGKNLLNPTIEQTQVIEPLSRPSSTAIVQSYKKGISLNLGVKINLN
ncbi:TonB-dependent receptor domain-containing protein [Labilibacter marinus]|uniref:TonB-dependent receptor domain-containing protein n=1 Tax=Labilibacter marinus TaxID=1477105 RepID=UPI001301045C|nr:TonB-dependent receptor [Labilibacter marinus]